MDPNAALREVLETANDYVSRESAPSADECADICTLLAEHILAMDEWLKRGGFLPHGKGSVGTQAILSGFVQCRVR